MKPIEVQATAGGKGTFLFTISNVDETMLITLDEAIKEQIKKYEARLATPDWTEEHEYEERTFIHSMLAQLYQFLFAIQEAKTI